MSLLLSKVKHLVVRGNILILFLREIPATVSFILLKMQLKRNLFILQLLCDSYVPQGLKSEDPGLLARAMGEKVVFTSPLLSLSESLLQYRFCKHNRGISESFKKKITQHAQKSCCSQKCYPANAYGGNEGKLMPSQTKKCTEQKF